MMGDCHVYVLEYQWVTAMMIMPTFFFSPNSISSYHPWINNCLYPIYKASMKLIQDKKYIGMQLHQVIIIIISSLKPYIIYLGPARALYFNQILFNPYIYIFFKTSHSSMSFHDTSFEVFVSFSVDIVKLISLAILLYLNHLK